MPRALLDLYADKGHRPAEDQRDEILALAELARTEEWFNSFRDVLRSDLTSGDAQQFVEFENIAARIRSYEPELVPGILQTDAYAAAVTAIYFPQSSSAERERFVEFRLARRRRVLDRPEGALRLDVAIGEAALRRVYGSSEVMREQLAVLLDDVRDGQENISIRVVPVSLAIPAATGGPFLVMDLAGGEPPALVYLESRGGAQYLHSATEVERYGRLYAELTEKAADAVTSEKMIEEAIRGLPG